MNILQIHNVACPPTESNLASGIVRVVTQLSDYYRSHYADQLFMAYFRDMGTPVAPCFSSSIKIGDIKELGDFIEQNHIQLVQFNATEEAYVRRLPEICAEAHRRGARVVYCLHYIPGYEGLTYGSAAEVLFSIKHGGAVVDKLKKWAITTLRPLSTQLIHKAISGTYRRSFEAVDRVVVFTQQYISRYMQIVGGTDRNKLCAIPNPLSFIETYPPPPAQPETSRGCCSRSPLRTAEAPVGGTACLAAH